MWWKAWKILPEGVLPSSMAGGKVPLAFMARAPKGCRLAHCFSHYVQYPIWQLDHAELATFLFRIHPCPVISMLQTVPMTFANMGSLGTKPGQRDAVVSILLRPMPGLKEAGCLLYEVGVNDDAPDTVFVSELWESAEAHLASLQLDSVRAAIAEAMPLLSGEMGGSQFTVVGSPLR